MPNAQCPMPAAHRDRKDTCQLTALSIGLSRRHHPVIWSAKALPSDSSRVVAVPTGGALVLSRDLALFCRQGGHSALALNASAMGGQAPRKIDFATMVSWWWWCRCRALVVVVQVKLVGWCWCVVGDMGSRPGHLPLRVMW
jgi:hypothetical protein